MTADRNEGGMKANVRRALAKLKRTRNKKKGGNGGKYVGAIERKQDKMEKKNGSKIIVGLKKSRDKVSKIDCCSECLLPQGVNGSAVRSKRKDFCLAQEEKLRPGSMQDIMNTFPSGTPPVAVAMK